MKVKLALKVLKSFFQPNPNQEGMLQLSSPYNEQYFILLTQPKGYIY